MLKKKMFDRDELRIRHLEERASDMDISMIKNLDDPIRVRGDIKGKMGFVANRIIDATRSNSAVIMMMGAHVIKSGLQRYIIDLMKRKALSCVSMNGAGMIHDFELALTGRTTESVARYIKNGEFGLWRETGMINDIVRKGYIKDKKSGMGAVIGKKIDGPGFPYSDISILAAGYRYDVPVTVHVGIGYDIINQLPNYDPVSSGVLSYNDFLIFAQIVKNIEKGVLLNFGSAVMGPEVFLKALSMARNVMLRNRRPIKRFTSVVFDLHRLPSDINHEPSKKKALYYFRPWKTLLIRTVSGGGKSRYIRSDHSKSVPALWRAINIEKKEDF